VVRIDVLERDERFVHYAPGALALGIRSSLSIPLVSADVSVASINLYSFEQSAFTDQTVADLDPVLAYITDTITRSSVFGASLSLLEGISQHAAEQDALNMAVGLLMSRLGMSEHEATQLIERRATESDTSLLDSAGIVIAMVTTTDARVGPDPQAGSRDHPGGNTPD
jgi:GAF domain-containing protein